MNKSVLRKVYLEKRKTLTNKEFERRNSLIFEKSKGFLEKYLQEHRKVHLFSSIQENYEVNTWPIIHWLHENNAEVILPRTGSNRQLTHHQYRKGDPLHTNKWGIAEPISNESLPADILDVVFVPMICFDKAGHRIGYGGGFYDVFLSQVSPDCLKIGLCLSPPLDEIPYIEKLDIKLDHCITHLKVYSF